MDRLQKLIDEPETDQIETRNIGGGFNLRHLASNTLAVALVVAGLAAGGCTPKPEIMPTPADQLEGAWYEFERELRGVGDLRYWNVGADAVRELPALDNLTWTKMVSAMNGNFWTMSSAVMRCAVADLEGTVMTLVLRYGLVLHERTDDDHPNCWSGACEVRITLDLRNVNDAWPIRRQARSNWLEFEMTDATAQIAEREFIAGDWTRCRLDRELLSYGHWGDYHEAKGERRVRPCFIPSELQTRFEVLVDRARRIGPAG